MVQFTCKYYILKANKMKQVIKLILKKQFYISLILVGVLIFPVIIFGLPNFFDPSQCYIFCK